MLFGSTLRDPSVGVRTPTQFKPAISAYALSVVTCKAHVPLPRQSRLAALQLQVVKEALHRADRFQGVRLFDSCAALVDGDIARRTKGVSGCRDIMGRASQPTLHV